ncbi:Metallo-dependent phosphatase [Suillus paluster]|uniref:Metallo-dependent phosphatase n=1 Tax=Suillus paluster TaxID=48578 RepID=UPI001B868CB7|nr:Metallo-dependent phosphatase [Suillus paluster]KAG1735141.1 Metallo-dependent phosphatase [Suillus paluster]
MSFIYERRTRKSRLLSRNTIINLLRFFWVVIVIWCEFGVFFYSLSDCKWPDKELREAGPSQKPTRVLLISDPQLPNPRRSGISWFGHDASSTRYLRKGWSVVTRLHPHVVVWLGDVLASGRYVTNEEEYEDYVDEFKGIFTTDKSVPNYFVPGNTDVGLGESSAFSKNARKYFTEYFGPLNQEVTLAGHRFVFIDAPGLVDEDYRRHGMGKQYETWTPAAGGPIEFIASLAIKVPSSYLAISHCPDQQVHLADHSVKKALYEPVQGHGYQNMLGKQTTGFVLHTLRPAAVFSGDNRDYCNMTHRLSTTDTSILETNSVREVTVKSFSRSRHIRRPGFQLLSLIHPDYVASPSSPTFADVHCLLPDTFRIFSSIYLPALVLTAIAILYQNIAPNRHYRRFSTLSPVSVNRSRPGSPPPGPESAIWTNWSPRNGPTSPTTTLPPSLRIPSAKEIFTFRALSSSSPESPHSSPLLSPIPLFHAGHEDEMNPIHYPSQHHNDHAWPSGEDTHEAPTFLPSPSARRSDKRWSWSWSFVFRGRRRRMTITLPTWGEMTKLASFGDSTSKGKRRGLVWRLAGDSVSVALPAVIIWALIGWLFF